MLKECPVGWSECELCNYQGRCNEAIEEEEKVNIKEIVEIVEKQVTREAVDSAKKIIDYNSVNMLNAESEEFWKAWAKTSPPDPQNRTREPIASMSGPVARGGSKAGRRKKSSKGNKVYIDSWEGI